MSLKALPPTSGSFSTALDVNSLSVPGSTLQTNRMSLCSSDFVLMGARADPKSLKVKSVRKRRPTPIPGLLARSDSVPLRLNLIAIDEVEERNGNCKLSAPVVRTKSVNDIHVMQTVHEEEGN